MSAELIAQIALELVPGLGSRGAKQLIAYCGSASNVFKEEKKRILKIPGVGTKLANELQTKSTFGRAESILGDSERIGSEILHYTNPKYPARLKQIIDAPNLLFKKGNSSLNLERTLAIVGTRNATNYGKKVTESIIEELKAVDVQVISGLAYGIDIQAHKKCLENNLSTIAVLAGGLDKIYPAQHKRYAIEILEEGAILSESFPGTKPDAHLFPARNRIIAGLADAIIVVEAAEKGGALITANLGDSYHKPVFAVPGNLGSPFSVGTNRLIASQKAVIYTRVSDLIYYLNWENGIKTRAKQKPTPKLEGNALKIYQLLAEKGTLDIDSIAIQTALSPNELASILLSLEFDGVLESLPGKKYQLK
jgi:DNA processing protein